LEYLSRFITYYH